MRFTIGDAADLVLDFPASEVRPYDGESVRYWFTTEADLVATNLARREIDWSNSLFLSMRFSASRIGKFNEYLYTFFKCLSPDRLDYVENWYSEQSDTGEDIASTAGSCSAAARTCTPISPSSGRPTAAPSPAGCTTGSSTCRPAQCLTSRGHEIRARRQGQAPASA